MKGLQRLPLIGRKFAQNQKGIYVPKKEDEALKKLARQLITQGDKTIPRRRTVNVPQERANAKAVAKRHAANKRARIARRNNRRVK